MFAYRFITRNLSCVIWTNLRLSLYCLFAYMPCSLHETVLELRFTCFLYTIKNCNISPGCVLRFHRDAPPLMWFRSQVCSVRFRCAGRQSLPLPLTLELL